LTAEVSVGRKVQLAAVGLVLFGALLRIAGFVQNASLSGDEAMLALSIGTRTLGGLLRPLDYGQVATIPFLWAERLITYAFGVSAYTLRMPTLVAGIALLWVLFRLARELLGPVMALIALALIATSLPLIRYSVEIKPYILDSLVSAALIWLSVRLLGRLEDRRLWAVLAIAGTFAVLLSAPALLVCGAIALAFAVVAVREKRWRLLPRLALLSGLWAGIFAAAYVNWYAPNAEAPYMRAFWAEAFLTPGSPRLFQRLWRSLGDLSCTLTCWRGLLDMSPLLIILGVIGSIDLVRRRGSEYGTLLAGPILAAFAASALGKYPIATRLVLFSAPLLAILVSTGALLSAESVERLLPPVRARWILLCLLYPSVLLATTVSFFPPSDGGFRSFEVKPLAELYQRSAGREPIWIFPRTAPAWAFYTTNWRAPDIARLEWFARMSGPAGLSFVNGASRGPRRPGQGATPFYTSRGTQEILGMSTGVQGRVGIGYSPPLPDAGWAETEVWRMRAVARPYIWIVISDFTHGSLDERRILMQAVESQGGKVVWSMETAGAVLYRIRLGPDKAV
jgi:hypothetical protein